MATRSASQSPAAATRVHAVLAALTCHPMAGMDAESAALAGTHTTGSLASAGIMAPSLPATPSRRIDPSAPASTPESAGASTRHSAGPLGSSRYAWRCLDTANPAASSSLTYSTVHLTEGSPSSVAASSATASSAAALSSALAARHPRSIDAAVTSRTPCCRRPLPTAPGSTTTKTADPAAGV